nr:hypothetical protein [Tanacetum cinerariifolium]GEY89633.1 hypothetical protein [Tanacetum cinerariifolium]
MEVDTEEDENEPELTYPYEEVDPLNPSPPTSESESEDVIEVEDTFKSKDETVPASVYEVGESSTAPFLREDSDGLFPGLMRRDIHSFFGQMASLSRRLCGCETTHALVEKKGKEKDEYYGKLILDLGNEVRSIAEQGTTTIEKLVEKLGYAEEKAESKKLKKELEEARGSGPVRGQDATHVVRECTFTGFMKYNPTVFYGTKGAVELRRWFEKTESIFGITECAEGKKVKEYNIIGYTQRFNELALICPRTVEPESVKVDAYIRGLTDNIKGEVTSFKPANLNEARKWEKFQSVNSSGKSNHKDNSCQTSLNNQKQENKRAMITAHTNGNVSFRSLPVYEHCFTLHVGQRTIKCHKCGKVGHKGKYCKEKNVATGANAQPILTYYDCGEQGHTRNRCLKKVKHEEIKEVRSRAYVIKDAEPQGPNIVTGTFLLNNLYASVLFDLGSNRSFVDTRFSSMLNIEPVKIDASYEAKLADRRVVSMNTVLKGCTLNLLNHLFKIDLMPIELGTFDVIIGMDWLVKHDAVIVCGEKVVRILYENKMFIVESDKDVS